MPPAVAVNLDPGIVEDARDRGDKLEPGAGQPTSPPVAAAAII